MNFDARISEMGGDEVTFSLQHARGKGNKSVPKVVIQNSRQTTEGSIVIHWKLVFKR
jgi:hypothetical protein